MQAKMLDQFRLDGRICFLSGATGHLGRIMAEALAGAGACVLVNARSEAAVSDLVKHLKSHGGEASAFSFDVTDQKAIWRAIERIGREHDRLDIIVNNASAGRAGGFEEIEASDFEQSYQVNVVAAFELVKAALPLLKKSPFASVINIASMYGTVSPDPAIYGSSGANNPPSYGAAKAALIQFTRYAACHFAPHIRVNCISPGPFPAQRFLDSDPAFHSRLESKVPMRRTGQPCELQGPLLFLASNASSYVTGVNLAVDGGWTAW
jgi:NAD(P)-dependent dehydrogenase (short-subunit alcohol dehydrogenase family)